MNICESSPNIPGLRTFQLDEMQTADSRQGEGPSQASQVRDSKKKEDLGAIQEGIREGEGGLFMGLWGRGRL